jgi:hypothetical protein
MPTHSPLPLGGRGRREAPVRMLLSVRSSLAGGATRGDLSHGVGEVTDE